MFVRHPWAPQDVLVEERQEERQEDRQEERQSARNVLLGDVGRAGARLDHIEVVSTMESTML